MSLINKIFPYRIKKWLLYQLYQDFSAEFLTNAQLSYGQEGEDLILNRFLENKQNGFYVDVGAHHPTRFSNTYYFYKKGWRGINVDALPGSKAQFDLLRPLDLNVEMGVGSQRGELIYHMFNEPALNTFSTEEATKKDGLNNNYYKIIGKKQILVDTLSSILDQYLPKGKGIDFLSIDVEGLDFEVLMSNDWSRYQPKFVLVECLRFSIDNFNTEKSIQFLMDKNYEFVAKSYNTLFFKLKSN